MDEGLCKHYIASNHIRRGTSAAQNGKLLMTAALPGAPIDDERKYQELLS
jgi:hypothetical protein